MLPTSSQNCGAISVGWRNEGRCVIETLCPQDHKRDGSLIQVDDVCLKAGDQQTELKQAAWSTALAVVHLGTGLSCLASAHNQGAVGVPENKHLAFLDTSCQSSSLSLLKRLCLDTVIAQTDGEPAIRELAREIQTKADTRQNGTCSFFSERWCRGLDSWTFDWR